ncbi:MAG: hypothetical protein IKR59_04085, partial [Lachnospiraceae bacterium]|nr:hypothetical protein [Lachnospiraceae bacterium]
QSGIREACIEARPHPDWAGPGWWRDMDILIDEAKKLGMKLWILDDAHFPTGYANGAVADADPSLCRQSLTIRSLEIPEGEDRISFCPADYSEAEPWAPNYVEQFTMANTVFRHYDDDRLIAAVALKKGGTEEDLIDLSGLLSEDTVEFVKPDGGEWHVALMNLSRNFGPHRNYINMMDMASCRKLIDAVYEPHWAHYADDFGKTIAGFFSDEPEIGNGHLYEFGKKIGELSDQAWSESVGSCLQEKWGENYTKYLPLIFDQDFDKDLQARIRADYMDVVSRLVEKCFSFQLGDWCRAHGVMYIGHLIEDNHQHMRTVSSLGHYFRGLAGQDMAGIDDIGGQVLPQREDIGPGDFMNPIRDGEFWHYTLGKLGNSMAAIDPLKKGRAMCEIFGNYGWSEGVKLEKYLADHLMVRGINNYVPHAFTAKEFPDPDCPPHFYAHGHNPQYRHFGALMKYMNRVCTLISGGKGLVPTAMLYNAEADWAGDYMYLQKPAIELYDHQIDYHFIPADVFTEEKYGTKLGKTLVVNGQEYRGLIVPYMQYIPAAALKAILALSDAGFPTVFVDALPEATVECGKEDAMIGALAGKAADAACIYVKPLAELAAFADETLGLAEVKIAPESRRIRVYHYAAEDSFYMFVNEAAEAYVGSVKLPKEGPWTLYDAWTNTLTGFVNGSEVPLQLCPSKSIFIFEGDYTDEIRKAEIAENEAFFGTAKAEDFSEEWLRSFCKPLDYPAFGEKKEISLPDTLAAEEPKFSGLVRYEKKLVIDGAVSKTVLGITDAYEGVEVFVNGTSLGIQVVPFYSFDLTPFLKEGENEIVIEVATTLEREAVDYPSRWAAMGVQMPEITVPSGISGKVILLR